MLDFAVHPAQEPPPFSPESRGGGGGGAGSSSDDTDESSDSSFRYDFQDLCIKISHAPPPISPSPSPSPPCKALAVLSGHVGSVSSLALCGEFILSASQGKDIIVWQQPDLRQFAKFGNGGGAVKAIATAGNHVFTGHQDSRVRAWKLSRSSENVFRLVDTLPTTKDYLGRFINQSNYVQTRRHHRRLWIEHADAISALAVAGGLIYSASWDKTLKIWRASDFKCLESIKAHDDAINAVAAVGGIVYTASADGTVKAWAKDSLSGGGKKGKSHLLRGVLEGHKDISLNSVVVSDDGRSVYAGGSDGYVKGWSVNKEFDRWSAVCEFRAHPMAVLCMCLMGEFLCTGSADKTIRVWRRGAAPPGKNGLYKHVIIKGHGGPVKCLQASPVRVGGGFMLYSGSLDRSLRVWWVPNSCHGAGEGSPAEAKNGKLLFDNDKKNDSLLAL
ncbi:protein JINGUBANG [Andrographis paniculata]|uniref:protein JINGUBANG n=1 Tax=Andrographis paniculata TaxID=175694 RepID=UPI0021E92ABD|nr:protein JINGUBANG [Andrographis paniculata]